MSDRRIEGGEEYPMEFEEGVFQMRFNCFCGNQYMFTIVLYDDGMMTLKIDQLGLEDKN